MDEKEIVSKFGERAWEICDTITKVVRGLRASGSVPTGKDARLVQWEVAIKHAMGTSRIPWDAGECLLNDLSERTIQAILRIRATEPNKVSVWLL